MAIHTGFSAQEGFLKTHESLALFNNELDAYKEKPSLETSGAIRNQFNEIKSAWGELKSDRAYQDLPNRCQTVEISMERTEKRVNKLLQKFAQNSPTQTSSSQFLSDDAQEIAQQAKQLGFIPFLDTRSKTVSDCFGNFYKCEIEFGGKHYLNAESAFQAQKYSDQPHVMARFERTNGYAAVEIAREVPMLPKRVDDWDDLELANVNKVDIMMQVLRAKFNQNPHLIELLLATGDAYLVQDLENPKNQDKFWSHGHNGDGRNQQGICLMKLRGESGGVGVVPKTKQYIQAVCETLCKNDPDLLEADSEPETGLSDECEQCKIKPKYYDSVTRYFHKYCSTNCVRLSRFQCDIPLFLRCDYCKREPKLLETAGRIHDYCGKTCAEKAGYFMQ